MTNAARVEVRRGGELETVHRVSIAVADGRGSLVASCGEPAQRTYWRSAAKPFQLLPFMASGGVAAYGFGARAVAVMAASHNGEAAHRAAAADILAAAGLGESHLLCGAHVPDNEAAWRELGRTGRAPTPLWNNCSGKHAGMLAHCRCRGWATTDYLSAEHPLQHDIAGAVARLTGERAEEIGLGIDGCGVPAFHLSLRGMATAYARLAGGEGAPEEWRDPLRSILEGMAAEPWFIAGTGRLCTRLAEVAGERVVAKVGAAGVYCAALRERGWGVALKVEDGSARAAGQALLEALAQLDVLREDELRALAEFRAGDVRNHAGTPVGESRACFRLAGSA
ncbi:MAG: asparaginase [Gemmatimonadota bacterium]